MSKALKAVLENIPDMTYLEFRSLGLWIEAMVAGWLEDEESNADDFDAEYFCQAILDWADDTEEE